MNSMTGYAYQEISAPNRTISVEIKSVNSRFLDLSINLPGFLSRLEKDFKQVVEDKVARGKVDIYIKIREKNSAMSVAADLGAAKAYADAIGQVSSALGYTEKVPLSLVIAQEGVLVPQRDLDLDSYLEQLMPVFNDALSQFCAEREREGLHLKHDILSMTQKIRDSLAVFTEWIPQMEEQFKENIKKRFEEILGDKIDEQRILQETAALLVRYTINEEVVRLGSHLLALQQEIEHNPAPGRKIDFICQEINREINTIGSKNQISQVGAAVIAAKEALENIREQCRNIE